MKGVVKTQIKANRKTPLKNKVKEKTRQTGLRMLGMQVQEKVEDPLSFIPAKGQLVRVHDEELGVGFYGKCFFQL